MKDDEQTLAAEGNRLAQMILHMCCKEHISDASYDRAMRIIRKHRKQCRAHEIDFPEMTIMVLPKQQHFDLFRKDLDEAAIQVVILNATVKFPNITADEIAWSVRKAWPGFDPRSVDLLPVLTRRTSQARLNIEKTH